MAEDLETYFEDILHLIEKGVSTYAVFQSEPLLEVFLDQIGSLTARVLYEDGSILQIFLTVDFTGGFPDWTHYSFHYMDSNNGCRFRYDDHPHDPRLPQFPHHKHEGLSEYAVPCSKPSIHQIQTEIRKWLHPAYRA